MNIKKLFEIQNKINEDLWKTIKSWKDASHLDINELKKFTLGLLFFYFLSKKQEDFLMINSQNFQDWPQEEKDAAKELCIEEIGCWIKYEYLFSNLIIAINKQEFDNEFISIAIKGITTSTINKISEEDFEYMFDDLNFFSSKLGKTPKESSRFIGNILKKIDDCIHETDQNPFDALPSMFDHLIKMFAKQSTNKSNEFYTSNEVSKIIAKIVTIDKKKINSLYDPCCGSASLLLAVGKEAEVWNYYGQEINTTTFNIARINMMLHGIPCENFSIKNSDTLIYPEFKNKKFDLIVAHPPFASKWKHNFSLLVDERFTNFGELAPEDCSYFAFIQHILFYLDKDGVAAVLAQHGPLFQEGSRQKIRECLIKNNWIDCVISLPKKINAFILVFKKNRANNDPVFFINARNELKNSNIKNTISDEEMQKIFEVYQSRSKIENYSYFASKEEIEKNNYDLSVQKYIKSHKKTKTFNLSEELEKLHTLEIESLEITGKINNLINLLIY